MAEKDPEAETLPTAGLELDQVAVAVTSFVEPSLKVSVAPSCCDVPFGCEPCTELTVTPVA